MYIVSGIIPVAGRSVSEARGTGSGADGAVPVTLRYFCRWWNCSLAHGAVLVSSGDVPGGDGAAHVQYVHTYTVIELVELFL